VTAMPEERLNQQVSPKINPEKVAYWFFRLNGCLTIVNFVVHPDIGRSQRTEVDILAVRFPYRCELITSGKPMKDHEVFKSSDLIDIVIAEVKTSYCDINGPWTNRPDENMHRVLYAIGAFKKDDVPKVAESLYNEGYYHDDNFRVRIIAIGSRKNSNLEKDLPKVVQITWDEILGFIYDRFNEYRDPKAHHPQWDWIGKFLYKTSTSLRNKDEFIKFMKTLMGIKNRDSA
jgi:hypothetical protein